MSVKQFQDASRLVAESEYLVAGWRELIAEMEADGREVTVVRDLLRRFEDELKARRSKLSEFHLSAR
jgi:hypothetical protein